VIPGFHSGVNEICALWDFTQRRTLICYRRFGTTYLPHLQRPSSPRRSLKMGPTGSPDTSWRNYYFTLRKIPK